MLNFSRESQASESASEEVELDSQDELSSDEDEELAPSIRAYATLMQNLAADSAPQLKRRKLDHPEAEKNDELTQEPARQKETLEDADLVDEEEEGPETATDGLLEVDDDLVDTSDPFEVHFADPDQNLLIERLKSLNKDEWASQKVVLPKVGKAVISLPQKESPKNGPKLTAMINPEALKLKKKLADIVSKQRPIFDASEKCIVPLMFSYQDILYCERNSTNSEDLRRWTCLHAVNHVFK